MFDGDPGTGTDYRLNGSGAGAWVEFDFQQGGYAQLSSVEMLARQDNYYTRINGTVIQGSNDNATWKTISSGAVSTMDWQILTITDNTPYRYIRIYNAGSWFGNMAEVRFHGTAHVLKQVTSVSVSSDQADQNRIEAGDTIKLTFTAREPINTVTVKIQGQDVMAQSDDKLHWKAEAAVAPNAASGQVQFSINYKTADGDDAPEVTSTTDGSSLVIVDKSKYIDVPILATVTASDKQYGNGLPADQVGYLLFDGDPDTFGDLNTGAGAYYTVDFGEGASIQPSEILLLPRTGASGRMNGLVIQGSSDNTNWTNLTQPLTGSQDHSWSGIGSDQMLDHHAYRYLRFYNGSAWFGDISETQIYGDLNYDTAYIDSKVLAPSGFTKGSYYLYQQKVNEIKAELAKPEADKMALIAEYANAVRQLVRVPLSLYSFDGNANDTYGSGVGTVNGTAAYEAGKSGKAINLNGSNSFVQLPASHPLAKDDQITIAAWVNWRGGNQWQRIFDFGSNTSQYLFLTPRSGSNTLRFAIKNGGGEQIVETSQLQANQWVHVAVTLGNGTAKLYVNGKLAATATGFTIKPSDFRPNRNYIGKSQWPDPLFNGMIDEFGIYNYALNDSEIQSLYAGVGGWTDKSLLELWLNQANQAAADHYMADSYAALQTAAANAKSVDANTDAAQSGIDAAADSLKTALDNLIYKVTMSLDPAEPSGANGWYKSPVTVTLSTYGSAEYSLDGGKGWQDYMSPITLNQDGKYSVSYQSRNEAGIAGDLQTATVNLDTTAPKITVTGLVYETYADSKDITPVVAVDDLLSGVDGTKTTVTLDTYSIQAGARIPLYTLPLGSHKLIVTASDKAGNTSSQTLTFQTTASIASMQALVTRFTEADWIDGDYIWIDSMGIAKSLQSKLAANELADFVNQVQALRGNI